MALPLEDYTLTYSEGASGWPSFYSYIPEYIKGMNQYLYTFSGGNLYRHNVNEARNNFYGVQYNTAITTVLNQDALKTKIFKTLDTESSDAWKVTLFSDIQAARDIESEWFKKKEGDWFAFVRGLTDNTDNFNMRSSKGLGVPITVTGLIGATVITYNFRISTPIQVGDTVYATSDPATVTPYLAGEITAITIGATSVITVDATGNTQPLVTDFIFYSRDQVAESQGLLGHYAVVTLENSLTTPTEIMAIKADVMTSYP